MSAAFSATSSVAPDVTFPLSPAFRLTLCALRDKRRALRRDATPAERQLWSLLRRRQLRGRRFRRQYSYPGEECSILTSPLSWIGERQRGVDASHRRSACISNALSIY
ncbi:MAG: hypothetical protein BRD45_01640 [Bacteroidetes bacterium QS_8_64_10]|nr:MAG: hypothetical protein BRD45_01640 [Bacteroidetes bacterium QS_8_64_10]